jgi:hypothetical protein
MSSAIFRINQGSTEGDWGKSRRDLDPDVEITLEAQESGHTYKWEVASEPYDSSATIVDDTLQDAAVTLVSRGGYIIRLITNDGMSDMDVSELYLGVPLEHSELCIPAFNETIQDNNYPDADYRGWERKMTAFLKWVDDHLVNMGEANDGVNLGDGAGIYKDKDGVDLQFRSLVEGDNITITEEDDTVVISGPAPGEVNAGENLGTGGAEVYSGKSGSDLQFRQLLAGTGVNITQDTTTITIESTAISSRWGMYTDDSNSMLFPLGSNVTFTGGSHNSFCHMLGVPAVGALAPYDSPISVTGTGNMGLVFMAASNWSAATGNAVCVFAGLSGVVGNGNSFLFTMVDNITIGNSNSKCVAVGQSLSLSTANSHSIIVGESIVFSGDVNTHNAVFGHNHYLSAGNKGLLCSGTALLVGSDNLDTAMLGNNVTVNSDNSGLLLGGVSLSAQSNNVGCALLGTQISIESYNEGVFTSGRIHTIGTGNTGCAFFGSGAAGNGNEYILVGGNAHTISDGNSTIVVAGSNNSIGSGNSQCTIFGGSNDINNGHVGLFISGSTNDLSSASGLVKLCSILGWDNTVTSSASPVEYNVIGTVGGVYDTIGGCVGNAFFGRGHVVTNGAGGVGVRYNLVSGDKHCIRGAGGPYLGQYSMVSGRGAKLNQAAICVHSGGHPLLSMSDPSYDVELHSGAGQVYTAIPHSGVTAPGSAAAQLNTTGGDVGSAFVPDPGKTVLLVTYVVATADSATNSKAWRIETLARRSITSPFDSYIISNIKTVLGSTSESDEVDWDVDVDTSGSAVRILATGSNTRDVVWQCHSMGPEALSFEGYYRPS